MGNLIETSTWEAGIYQWEDTDPLDGGPDGIDNVPTRQLANRTRFLYERVQPVNQGGTGITAFTAGDIVFATGAAALAKLPIGAANRVLTSSGTAPQWSTSLALTGGASFGDALSTSKSLAGAYTALTLNNTNVTTAAAVNVDLQSQSVTFARTSLVYDGSFWTLRLGTADNFNTAQVRGASFLPGSDNAIPLGNTAFRWSAVYAVNGVIQTSLPEQKEVTPAPSDADVLAALRSVEIAAFTYKDDPGFETGRKSHGRPVRQKHRQYGVMLPSLPEWARTTDDGINPMNVAALALRGCQLLDARLARIESALKLT